MKIIWKIICSPFTLIINIWEWIKDEMDNDYRS